MPEKLNRRQFVVAGTGTGVLASTRVFTSAPQVITRGVTPAVVAAANGNRSKDGAGLTCVAKAFKMINGGAVYWTHALPASTSSSLIRTTPVLVTAVCP